MKKLFNTIDSLCRHATLPGIWSTLRLPVYENKKCVLVFLRDESLKNAYTLPTAADPLWRRKWKAFLTDHADEVAALVAARPANAAATSSEARDAQRGPTT
jgi:hypothetical protein